VAERIRNTLENTTIADRSNHLIALPTISQGIAVFLEETTDFIKLVDLADQRLYIAKERGRDQIEPSLQALEETQPLPVIQTVED
jgi:GGDEF domain-containing protein